MSQDTKSVRRSTSLLLEVLTVLPLTMAARTEEEGPTLLSLNDLSITLTESVRSHLASSYEGLYRRRAPNLEATTLAQAHLDRVLSAMKTPPQTTICRVNMIQSTREEVINGVEVALKEWILQRHNKVSVVPSVRPHPVLDDVVCVELTVVKTITTTKDDDSLQNLANCTIPPPQHLLFVKWPKRKATGWPMTHRAVVCDRLCGEAVLRGADIFVRGLLMADGGVTAGETVAVYADLGSGSSYSRTKSRSNNKKRRHGGARHETKILRGSLLVDYYRGRCVFLGMGTACYDRADLFRLKTGVGIEMSIWRRAGPILPPLSGVRPGAMFVQNLPSIVVTHALQPQPNDVILDMCAAPGGKSLHMASYINNQATIVACDRSRRKMLSARQAFAQAGATCITPLSLDTTQCVYRNGHAASDGEDKSMACKSLKEVPLGLVVYLVCQFVLLAQLTFLTLSFFLKILQTAQQSKEDGLLNVCHFFPESFDRILLDPPCSALGLRPKLQVAQTTAEKLMALVAYQQRFVHEAVELLKPGGIMTYSTCTIHTKARYSSWRRRRAVFEAQEFSN